MTKVNLKKSRTKSYEEKLRDRQERMNLVERQEAIFMSGEDLSDNDEDAPFEVQTKREILPLIEEEPPLPEIQIQPKKTATKKKATITRVGDGEFTVKVDDTIQVKIKAPTEKNRKVPNKMSFKEKLLLANTKHKRHMVKGNQKHLDKWAKKKLDK